MGWGWAAGAIVAAGLAVGGCYAGRGASPAPMQVHDGRVGASAAPRNGVFADTTDWRDMTAGSVEELIAGRFAGVQVIGTGPNVQIRIRGMTSILGDNEPLFVIDGMPVSALPGRALIGINPRDVATIEVLKDAGSVAMWGVRGANGVIVITTRRGPR